MIDPRRPNSVVRWIDNRLPIVTFLRRELQGLRDAKKPELLWNFGSVAGFVLERKRRLHRLPQRAVIARVQPEGSSRKETSRTSSPSCAALQGPLPPDFASASVLPPGAAQSSCWVTVFTS